VAKQDKPFSPKKKAVANGKPKEAMTLKAKPVFGGSSSEESDDESERAPTFKAKPIFGHSSDEESDDSRRYFF
jgi:hypothetical protein